MATMDGKHMIPAKEIEGELWIKASDLYQVRSAPVPEPVGTAGQLFSNTALERLDLRPSTNIYITPLPVAEPYMRTWVGLTDEVIWLEYQTLWPFHPAEEPRLAKDIAKFARAIEAKLKEKNT